MQFTKPMIELVYELRRRVPSEMKPSVKLANPELLNELAKLYPKGSTITQALIKELLRLAGPEWESAWQLSDEPTTPDCRHVTRMYRGQISIESRGKDGDDADPKPQPSRRLMYRGQLVG